MKMNIKARATCLVFSKILIVINKYEKIYFTTYISDKRLSSFFFSFLLFLSIYSFLRFSLSFFVLNLSYPSRMCILFCLHIWAELPFLFWTFMSGAFFQVGRGCACIQCTLPPPPLRTRLVVLIVIS